MTIAASALPCFRHLSSPVKGAAIAIILALFPAFAADLGDTPLQLAAYRGDAAAVQTLLDQGADPNAKNGSGGTALLYGSGNQEVVRILLKHGANPNLASKSGITPLMAAAAHRNSHEIVGLLLGAGADVHAKRGPQEAVVLMSLDGDDFETLKLLLDHGASPQQMSGGQAISPLASAAYYGDLPAIKLLLDKGADINFNADFAGHALNWALYSGRPDIAKLLIERGADLHLKSPWGHLTPPMVFAAYNQSGDPSIARMLVERGADVNEANDLGATALSYALRSGAHTSLVAYLEEAGARPPSAVPSPKALAARRMPAEVPVKERAQRAIDLLQRSSTAFIQNKFVHDDAKCVSCHQQYLPAVTYVLAREHGLRIDERALGHQLAAQLDMWGPAKEAAREMDQPVPDAPVQVGYGLYGLHAVGYRADALTEALVRYLMAVQGHDGSWRFADIRPPLEGGVFTATAWAVRAIQLYPPSNSEGEVRASLARAAEWLWKAKPQTLGDRVMQLSGLSRAGETPERLQSIAQGILQDQGPDGGWAQLPGIEPDAWATGETLVALHEAGCLKASDKPFVRGVQFLLRTQYEDGSWWVHTRTWPFQPHFDSGFPHGNDQWISSGGTAWATMALLLTTDPDASAPRLPSVAAMVDAYAKSVASKPAAPPPIAPLPAGVHVVDFAHEIYPIFNRSCIKCHSGEKPKGGLSLTSREGLLKGGKSEEPAVVPGKAADSQLVDYVLDQVEDLEMPPLRHRDQYKQLDTGEVDRIRTWIDQGAVWNLAPPKT